MTTKSSQGNKLTTIDSKLDFELLDFLGQGVWAQVYKIRDNNRTKAVKLLCPQAEDSGSYWTTQGLEVPSQDLQERYNVGMGHGEIRTGYMYEEYKLTSRIYESEFRAFESLNTVGIVMPHFEAATLTEWSHRESYSEDIIPTLLTRISEQIRNIHNHHMLHRDLSPENILINQDRDIKIIDFGAGISHFSPGLKPAPATSLTGRPWLAPEYADENRGLTFQTTHSDLYAVDYIRDYLKSRVNNGN